MSTSLKALLLAAAGIVLVFLIGDRFGLRSAKPEPRTVVTDLDTAEVVSIRVSFPRGEPTGYELTRTAEGWRFEPDRASRAAGDRLAVRVLRAFRHLPVKRDMGLMGLLAERNGLTEGKWTSVTFRTASGDSVRLHLGRSTFAPGKVGAWTYVNLPGDPHVYAVEGVLHHALWPVP